MPWMIYGANGHTGAAVARRAVERGERPILAGRSAPKIVPLAQELGLEYVVVDIADPSGLVAALEPCETVVHCAGPFSKTWEPMVRACLETRTHYVDITGEIDVFESIYALNDEARAAGVVLLPGGGFDVVPTDCLAAMVSEALPGASDLDIAFKAGMDIGPGTAKTALEGAGQGGRARVNGVIQSVPLAQRQIEARFPTGQRLVSSIPWGDVASAYRSTGVPNITTYTVVPGAKYLAVGQKYGGILLRNERVQKAGQSLLDRFVKQGAQTTGGRSEVWVRASTADGQTAEAALTGPGAIPLTVEALQHIVDGIGAVSPGSHTPSTAFGADLITRLNGVHVQRPSVGK